MQFVNIEINMRHIEVNKSVMILTYKIVYISES